jgi:uncharacterized protein (DUF2336 family)
MTQPAPRYARLAELSAQTSSEDRRELLRTVTDALGRSATPASDAEFAQLDGVLSAVAQEYSVQVRTEFARMVAGSVTRFCESAQQFALDDIAVAAPVLKHAQSLSEDTLLKVVAEKSQAHMMAVTQRASISPRISHALVERGDDAVVTSLLANDNAQIADNTYEAVARRAETSTVLQRPLVGRKGVPMDLLNDLYHKVEAGLRQEIIKKFDQVPPGDLEKAFERSRARVTQAHRQMPEDFAAARKRVAALEGARQLAPPILATLLREGAAARTTFKRRWRVWRMWISIPPTAAWTPATSTHWRCCAAAAAWTAGCSSRWPWGWTSRTRAWPTPKPSASCTKASPSRPPSARFGSGK